MALKYEPWKIWKRTMASRCSLKKMRPRNSLEIQSILELFFASSVCRVIVEKWKMSAIYFIFITYSKLTSLMFHNVNIDSSLFISNLILNRIASQRITMNIIFEAHVFFWYFQSITSKWSLFEKKNGENYKKFHYSVQI